MTRIKKYLYVPIFGAFVFANACSGGDTPVDPSDFCGPNTTYNEDTRECDGLAQNECATGTKLVEGECVPDGSVICPSGTMYNESSGQCDPDISDCGEGTVLVDGECVTEDSQLPGMAEFIEAPEPNAENGTPGQITLPELGSSNHIYGCIQPISDEDGNGNLDPDFDFYVFSTGAPTVINVKVDGIGGLAGGFSIFASGGPELPLVQANWGRFGINMTGDTSERKVYLPTGATYILSIGDSRSILTGEGAGSINACYFVTITQEALPAAQPLVDNAATGTLGLDVYLQTNTEAGAFIVAQVSDASGTAQSGVSIAKNPGNVFVDAHGFGGWDADGIAEGPGIGIGVEVLYIIDPVINYGLSPVEYNLTVANIGVELPTDGGSITVPDLADWIEMGHFTVAADNTVIHMEVSTDAGQAILRVYDGNFTLIADLCSSGFACESGSGKIYFETAGDYYVYLRPLTPATSDSDMDGVPDYQVTSTIEEFQTAEIITGMPLLSQELGSANYFRTTTADWLTYALVTTDFGGAALTEVWAGSATGSLGSPALPLLDSLSGDAGRLYLDGATDLILAVTDDGTAAEMTTPVFDITVDERAHTSIVIDTANLTADITMLTLENPVYVLVKTSPEYNISLVATGTDADVQLEILDRAEAVLETINATGAGEAELHSITLTTGNYVAYRITDLDGDTSIGSVDLSVVGVAPVSYALIPQALTPTADVCNNGNNHSLTSPDEALTSMIDFSAEGFAFKYYGFDVTEFQASTNGWLTFNGHFNPMYTNEPLPSSAAPNNLIAGYWDDLDNIILCTYYDVASNTYTIQWSGTPWQATDKASFQVILHGDNNNIDILTLVDHELDGSSGTTGIENSSGLSGTLWFFNTPQDFSTNNGARFIPDSM